MENFLKWQNLLPEFRSQYQFHQFLELEELVRKHSDYVEKMGPSYKHLTMDLWLTERKELL